MQLELKLEESEFDMANGYRNVLIALARQIRNIDSKIAQVALDKPEGAEFIISRLERSRYRINAMFGNPQQEAACQYFFGTCDPGTVAAESLYQP